MNEASTNDEWQPKASIPMDGSEIDVWRVPIKAIDFFISSGDYCQLVRLLTIAIYERQSTR